MKNLIITGILILTSVVCFGQSRKLTDDEINRSGASKLVFVTTVKEAKELAKKDIKNGTPFLLLQSGIAPVIYTTDSIFENKYNVYYYENGCAGPDHELMSEYNSVILDHLLSSYGKKWQKMIRKDVVK